MGSACSTRTGAWSCATTRYLEIYGLEPDDVQPGTPLIDLIR